MIPKYCSVFRKINERKKKILNNKKIIVIFKHHNKKIYGVLKNFFSHCNV